MEPTDAVADGTVTRELQRGYQVRDRVLRPALVVVATAPPTND
jgi:molecular chaperone GrpE (heat shock protein)